MTLGSTKSTSSFPVIVSLLKIKLAGSIITLATKSNKSNEMPPPPGRFKMSLTAQTVRAGPTLKEITPGPETKGIRNIFKGPKVVGKGPSMVSKLVVIALHDETPRIARVSVNGLGHVR